MYEAERFEHTFSFKWIFKVYPNSWLVLHIQYTVFSVWVAETMQIHDSNKTYDNVRLIKTVKPRNILKDYIMYQLNLNEINIFVALQILQIL